MAEKKQVAGKDVVSYDGLFNMKELYNFIDSWFAQHGFDKNEKKNSMQLTQTGKYVYLDLMPTKGLSDYAKATIRVELISEGYTDVVIKKDGRNVNMNKGKVNINLFGLLVTDSEGRWSGKPLYFILRILFEKFIYTTIHSKYAGMVKNYYNEFKTDLKNFFNMYDV